MRLYKCDICGAEYEHGGKVTFQPRARKVGGAIVWSDGSETEWPFNDPDADLCPECCKTAAEALVERGREVMGE